MTAPQEPESAPRRQQPGELPPSDGEALDLVALFADDELSNYEFRSQQDPPDPVGDDRLG